MSTSFKAAFVITARDKEKWIGRALDGAFAQTYPCHIVLSDQCSKDSTYDIMVNRVAQYLKDNPNSIHTVDLFKCPIDGPYGMKACNDHFFWDVNQIEEDWVFQCSADDFSLPDRVKVCMDAAQTNPAAVIACTMKFIDMSGKDLGASQYTTGYIRAGDGLNKLIYGSTIHAFKRDFIMKVGSAKDCTMDVYYGFLAAISEGYYTVNNPQHVHYMDESLDNMGFQGKMRAAKGDDVHKLNELNRFQLLNLYYEIAVRAQELYPMMHESDRAAITNMILGQAKGWLDERKNLHTRGINPGVI